MTSYFWKRNFYLNNNLFVYSRFADFSALRGRLFGVGNYLIGQIGFRLENALPLVFSAWSLLDFYLFFFYLSTTFPALLGIISQLRFNMSRLYLTKTYRGVSLFVNRPLHRKTRARTYLRKKNNNLKFLN